MTKNRRKGIFTSIVAVAAIVAGTHGAEAQQPILSPRDSVEVSFNGQKVSVNYGRPSMRGRKIMGGLVPFNRWWRTGANEATAFVTEADLVVGDSVIPKGSYTLYTLPSETQWKLMVNRQTGQWGTVYNAEYDLMRVPMKQRTLAKPVEKFTIAIEKNGNGAGVLRFTWETTQVWVDFKVKQPRKNANGSKSTP